MDDEKLGVIQSHEAFFDDADSVLGIERRASGGIKAEFDRQEQELRDQMAEIKKKDAAPALPSNHGAYDGLDARARALQAQGLSLAEATAQALTDLLKASDEPQPKGDSYLGASVESLMHVDVTPGSSGSKNGRLRKPKPKPQTASGRSYDDENVPVVSRARRLHEQYQAQRAASGNIGRPLLGNERRMTIASQVEPGIIVDLHALTGKKSGDLLVEMHELLRMARNGDEAQAILARINALLEGRAVSPDA